MNTFTSYDKPVAITPSDTVDMTHQTLGNPPAIWCGGAGVVAAVLEDGTVVNFTVVAGSLLPVKAKRVNSTNTTATLLVALFRA